MTRSKLPTLADPATLDAYAREADGFAARATAVRRSQFLDLFCSAVPRGGTVLDLGCGAGWAAEQLVASGYNVHALDASPELAAIASAKLPRPVRVCSFEDLDDMAAFDGIFANAALLHIERQALPGMLGQLRTALKPGGALFASFKQGTGEGRDRLGRFYTYYTVEELQRLFAAAGFRWLQHLTAAIRDYTGEDVTMIGLLARRG